MYPHRRPNTKSVHPTMPTPLTFIQNNANIFARVGSVVASYRTRGTTRYGPYFRVAYRTAGRQCSIYLGRCKELADRARALLAQLQQPRNYLRMCRKANRERRATLRRVIRGWQQTIRAYGLDLRGCEIRGWRRLGIPRYDKTTSYTAAQKAAAAALRSPPPDPRYWQNRIPVDQQHPDASLEPNRSGWRPETGGNRAEQYE
jgi:hypothetical protein